MTNTFRTALILAAFTVALSVETVPGRGAEEAVDPGWAALSAADLENARAKGVVQDFDMQATMAGGSVNIDGAVMNNDIAEGAFAGASGISNVIQNNGNHAIIQNGVVVNVNVYQGAAP